MLPRPTRRKIMWGKPMNFEGNVIPFPPKLISVSTKVNINFGGNATESSTRISAERCFANSEPCAMIYLSKPDWQIRTQG